MYHYLRDNGEATVTRLVELVGLTQPTVSYHLKEMKELGDVLIVALNSDSSVRNFKGEGRPINNEIDRAFVIGNIKGVDYVVIFDENDPLNILRRLKPDVHVKGGNPIPERVSMEKEIVESYGGKLICLDLVDGYSTTEIMERMKSG